MDLGKELKTALDRVKELHADNNATKDELIEARRDLAFAKGRIIDFQTQTASQKTRLEELEARLRSAGKDLAEGLKETDLEPKSRQEMELLRGIISRQLKVQERRKLAKDAILAEIQRAGLAESPLNAQFDALLGQELKLTPEESELIKDFKIDQDFIFADRPNEREFANADLKLQESTAIKSKLARRAYSNERYLAAREVFQSILDENPGHVNTILNLGVVHLKNDEIKLAVEAFHNALVIRGDNLPFAHFMLGVCYYHNALRANRERDEQEGMAQARLSLEKSLNQNPNNAEAHVFLGSVAGEGNELDKAEHHFKEAIRINPTLTEPYYNLAVIYNERGQKEEAREYYKKALENGAPFDPKLDYLLSAVVQ
jgi:tetratricopeptide (TPR) repeat protein